MLVFLVVTLVLACTIPAFAWELTMKGDTEWRYRYWTRTGDVDIFGPMDGSTVYLGINHLKTFPTTGTQNGPSSTFGVLAGENCYGKEMSFVDYRMTVFPKIKVNPAITLDASVNLTSLGIWSDGMPYNSAVVGGAFNAQPGYINSLYVPIGDRPAAVDIPNTHVTLQWLKLEIITPMVNFSLGYKSSSWGMGLWKHACNRASTSFGVSAVYGPFTFTFAPYFARNHSSWRIEGGTGTSRNEGATSYQRQEQRRNYFPVIEGDVRYRSGDLEIGILSDSYVQAHANRVNPRLSALTGGSTSARPDQDEVRYRIDTYMKYFNGRFFFDAEGAWWTRWRRGRGSADPSSGAGAQRVRRDQDADAFIYGLETGVVAGPSKVTFNYVRATGQDPSTRITDENVAQDTGVTSCYMRDWGLLMYYMYGTGSGWDAAGDGQPTDFHHLGGRIDYAIASNLNMFCIFSYAWRDQPTMWTLGGDFRGAARLFTNDDIAQAQGIIDGYFGQTAVPESAREIGWEINAGFAWKLLENLVWKSTFAYWKPGTWWSHAYPNTAAIYRANAGIIPAVPPIPAGALQGIGRDIDPLFATESTLLVSF
jgi:hypothetical protein